MNPPDFTDLLWGATRTVYLTVGAWLVGLPVAFVLGTAASKHGRLRSVLRVVGSTLSVIPLVAVLFWIHYPLQDVLRVAWSPFLSTIGLLTVHVCMLGGGIIAEEMKSVRDSWSEVAQVNGVSERVFVRSVIVPAAMERSVARLLVLAIATVHLTMFGSLIGVDELFREALRLNSSLLRPVAVFTAMAATYAALCVPLFLLARKLGGRREQ